jgi:hypothetical protein
MKYHISILLFLFTICCTANAQTSEIDGSIKAFNRYPLKNVSVTAKKSKQSTVTDDNGRFKISVKKNDQLVIEADAFKKFIYRPKDNENSINVNLIYDDKKKNKEIAIDGGYISREHLEEGLKNYANDNNVYSSFTNVFEAITYTIPQAKLISENGLQKVQMRGANSTTGSNAALMVVNGFLTEDISYIIPSNLVSIKLLQPSAAAIYGTGSLNGVIEIKTK